MDDVEVKPSGIEGLGVFAARSFAEGDRIRRVNVVREVTPGAPLREDLGERADHCNYPDGKVVLYGLPDRYINHSCDPNAYEVHEKGATYLVARRLIPAGSEITCDYNINIANGTAWPCRCGAPRCQGEVVGDFFRLCRQWQREYRPLLAGWFIGRHRELIDAIDRERYRGVAGRTPRCTRPAPVVSCAPAGERSRSENWKARKIRKSRKTRRSGAGARPSD